jgi:hypothetical protein
VFGQPAAIHDDHLERRLDVFRWSSSHSCGIASTIRDLAHSQLSQYWGLVMLGVVSRFVEGCESTDDSRRLALVRSVNAE